MTATAPARPAKRAAKQLADARRVVDGLVAGVEGVLRVTVATHADGSLTVSVRVKPA